MWGSAIDVFWPLAMVSIVRRDDLGGHVFAAWVAVAHLRMDAKTEKGDDSG